MSPIAEIDAEALYFRLFHSYLLQRPSLKDDYELLRSHYEKYPESFSIFNKFELINLKRMQEDIRTGTYNLFRSDISYHKDLPESLKKEKTDQNHRNTIRSIIRRIEILEPFTGPIDDANTEHPTAFGYIDIMVQSGRCVHVVELKTSCADHSIAGQMMKYYVGMSLRIINRHYDVVKMITLCPGYNDAAFRILKQIGAKTLLLNAKSMSIREI